LPSAVEAPTPAAAPPAPVVAAPAAEPTPAPLVAEKGDLQLNGLYLQISSLAVGGRLQFAYYHYCFLADGHVFYGIPPGGTVKLTPTAEDLAAMTKASAKSLGVYKVTGGNLTIQYPGGKPQTDPSSIQKNGDLGTIVVNGAWAVRQGQFKDGQTLDGRYTTTATIKAGGDEAHGGGDRINISSLNTLDFHADGTFTGAGAVDLGVTTTDSHSGSGSKSADHGKYQLSGNTLTMTHADGKTESITAYPIPDKDETPPQHININGVIYAHEK
jgi:hypothetical protein